jgi:hypothetical protein
MKNKLLTTTAISAAMLMGVSVANAQTTVKGQVHLVYRALSNDAPLGKAAGSYRAFGKETQLDVQTKGKLNNGMDYAAGFSIEHDGEELSQTNEITTRSSNGMFNENVYIDLISGKTTFTVGADHIQNPDFTYVNLVGLRADPEDIFSGISNNTDATRTANGGSLYPGKASTSYDSFGAGIVQDLGIAKASYFYTPGGTATGDNGGATTFQAQADSGESRHEIMLRGDLGVKGLDATVFYSMSDPEGQTAQDNEGKMLGLKYTMGNITVGGEIKKNIGSSNTVTGKSFGAAYAVNKDLSVGIGQLKADGDGLTVGNKQEQIRFVSAAYSLGPVVTGLTFAKGENLGGTNVAGIDGNVLFLQLSTAF